MLTSGIRKDDDDLSPWSALVLFAAFVLAALFVRLYGISFGTSYHPDERHIIMTTMKLAWGDMNPHFFAYGSLPFYLLKFISEGLGYFFPSVKGYDQLFIVGRALSAAAGALTCFFLYLLGYQLYRRRDVAIGAVALLALNMFHVQLSHFYAVDILLTFLSVCALLSFLFLARRGSFGAILLSGVLIGISLGTKISALSLFVPLIIALLSYHIRQGTLASKDLFLHLLWIVVIAFIAFIAVEPYALIDWNTFKANNLEQIHMVRGDWTPPYTVQYAGTMPYFYHLKQMGLYTIGIPISILVFGGVVWSFVRQIKKISGEELILLAWVAASFFAIGREYVKFPRYLIPLYPPLFLLGSFALFNVLSRIFYERPSAVGRWFRGIMAILICWAGIRTMGLLHVYSIPHSYEEASRWIFEHVKANSKILGVHWDDKLPVSIPGFDAQMYDMWNDKRELSIYEEETPQRKYEMVQRLSEADYFIFPTQRIPGSILRVPEKKPFSSSLLQLLYDGKLGYKLVHSVKTQPRFWIFSFRDDLADESLSVYDHPKVWIFKNVERLSPQELTARISNPNQFGALPTIEQVLQRDAGTDAFNQSHRDPQFIQLFLWIAIIEILGFSALPIMASLMPLQRSAAFGFSKVAGLSLFGYLAWIGPLIGMAQFNFAYLLLLVIGLFAVSIVLIRGRPALCMLGKKEALLEGAYFSVLLLFLAVRAFNPEIFWGEKPMDSSFLNYFVRLESFPVQDPWFSGLPMQYYYLGYYILAALVKITGISTSIAYNLAVATIPALLFVTIASFFIALGARGWTALLGSLFLILGSNLDAFRLIGTAIKIGKTIGFDSVFWPSSRTFTGNAINEYPVWAALFADLHPHFIALPFTVFSCALCTLLVVSKPRGATIRYGVHIGFTALSLALLYALNTWDAITLSIVISILFLTRAFSVIDHRKWAASYLGEFIRDFLLVGVIAAFLLAPYFMQPGVRNPIGYGWVNVDEFNNIRTFMYALGHFIIVGIASLAVIATTELTFKRIGLIRAFTAVALFCVPLGICLLYPRSALGVRPWGICVVSGSLLAIAAILSSLAFDSKRIFYCVVSMGAAGLMICGVEMFFLIDHANTVFKFYNGIWILLGSSAVILTEYVFRTGERFARIFLSVVFLSVFTVTVVCGVAEAFIVMDLKRVPDPPRPTLDGTAYLERMSKDEYALIRWLKSSVKKEATLLEAYGPSYQAFTRICMHTGIPVVLGWEWHVQQRGADPRNVRRRADDIGKMYNDPAVEKTIELLRQYAVDLIVVGDLERKTYSPQGLAKFDEHPEAFPLLFRSGEVSLYTVRYSTFDPDFGGMQAETAGR